MTVNKNNPKTHYNFTPFKHVEVNPLPSDTIENEAMTVREMFQRHAEGLIPPMKEGEYDPPTFTVDDVDITKNPDIDLVDIQEMANTVQEIEQTVKDIEVKITESKEAELLAKNTTSDAPASQEGKETEGTIEKGSEADV